MDYKLSKFLWLLILFFGFISCKNKYSDVDCVSYDYSDCTTIEPDEAVLKIRVTINSENTHVPVFIYKGPIEDSIVVSVDTINTQELVISLPVNEYYSAKAIYKKNSQQIIAVDGDKIEKKGTSVCDSTCWSVNEGKINLEIKN